MVASNFAHFNSIQKDNISVWFPEKSKENTVWGKWIYSQALRKYLHNDNEEISRINSSNFFCTSISIKKTIYPDSRWYSLTLVFNIIPKRQYVLIATNGYGFEHGLSPCFTTPTTTTLLQLLIHVILFLSYAFLLKIKDENIQFMQEIKKWRCVINVKL